MSQGRFDMLRCSTRSTRRFNLSNNIKQPRNPSPHTIAAVHATRKDPPHAGISDTNDCGDTLRGHSAVKNMPDPPHTLALAGNFLDLTMTTWKYTLHNVLNHRSVPEPYFDVLWSHTMLWRNSSRPILAASVSSVEPPTYNSWSGLVNVQKFRTNADTLSNLRSSLLKQQRLWQRQWLRCFKYSKRDGSPPFALCLRANGSNKVLVWDMKIMKTMQLIEFWATFLVAD